MGIKFIAAAFAMSLLLSESAAAQVVAPDRLEALDARVVLPAGARPKETYVRFYLQMELQDLEDLPFTTMVEVRLRSSKVLVGLFIAPGSWGVGGPPGVRLVSDREALPFAVHGGCRAVNVVIDLDSGETLGSWCNVDDNDRPVRRPRKPSPVYLPGASNSR